MKTKSLTKRVIGFTFALSLLLGVGMTASSTAQAQYQDRNWQREQIRRQREYEREQMRRQRQAERDWRYGDRRYDNRGYDNRGYGNTADQYNYGGSYQLRQTALNAGYNEGVKEGRRDRNNGERFEFRDEDRYRSATTDYSSRLGDRSLYQQYFRLGFQNGYTDGYRGY